MITTSIIGNITRDATLREVDIAGVKTPVVTFTVAANYGTRNENGDRSVQYVNCTMWRNFAQKVAPYLKKGQMISAVGTPRISVYQSQQDRTWRGQFELTNIQNFEFLGGAKHGAAAPAPEAAPETVPEEPAAEADNYPFE